LTVASPTGRSRKRGVVGLAGDTSQKYGSIMSYVSRRLAAACAGAFSLALALPSQPAHASGSVVAFGGYSPGTIVVHTGERRLYLVMGNGQAVRYPVGVGRRGKQWSGMSRIDGKYLSPAWSPPYEIRREHPELPRVIPGGAPNNPMGVAAMTLA